MKGLKGAFLLLLYCISLPSFAQDIPQLPAAFLPRIQRNAADLDSRITRQTERYLQQLSGLEKKLHRRLQNHDSATADRLFNGHQPDYQQLLARLHGEKIPIPSEIGAGNQDYLPYMDSLKTALGFLQQTKITDQKNVTAALSNLTQLQEKIRLTGQIDQLVHQRQEEIRQTLANSPSLSALLQKHAQAYAQTAYYYNAQTQAYKDILNDPSKLTRQGLEILGRSPAYQSFFKSHSELAGIFGPPQNPASRQDQQLAGLQTRTEIQTRLQGRLEAGGPDAASAVQQKIQQGRTALKSLQQKVLAAGGSNSTMNIPEFRPNNQRTKTFWNRLEYGVNIQSLPATYTFPATSDFGASLGYRLNDRSTIGIGASYKMGWGKDIGHIAISSQGLGLRTWFDTRIKGSFSATGGFEYNYQMPFPAAQNLQPLHYWTNSGLIGLTKTISLKNRVFSKTKVQLLWNFLCYSQKPRTQPLIFRIGYNL